MIPVELLTEPLTTGPDWDAAPCVDPANRPTPEHDPWFPDAALERDPAYARAVCASCPDETKAACLAAALAHEGGHNNWRSRHGIAGGLTPNGRAYKARRRET